MSTGILNKLKEMIGKDVLTYYSYGHLTINFPGSGTTHVSTILRIENDDCVVLKDNQTQSETYVPVDKIAYISISN